MKVFAKAQSLRRARLAGQIQAQVQSAAISSDDRDAGLAITDVRVYPLREPVSGRRYVAIRVQTRSQLVGFGETDSVSAAELATVRQLIIGRSATSYEVLRQSLSAFPNLQAAVNMALLDIVGKLTRAPVYQLLGGPTRFKARALGVLAGASDDALLVSLERLQTAGHRAFLTPIPPVRAPNQGQAFVKAVLKRLEKLRTAGGENLDYVLDAAGALSPGDASVVASAIEPLGVMWFDEPCALSNASAVRKLSDETVMPLGFGRHISHAGEFQGLLREEAIDVLRPGISHNGISQIRKMAALAESYYVAVAPHHEGGPIATAAALHLAASLPNFFIQQIPWAQAEADKQMRRELTGSAVEDVADGFARLPTGPGLGLTISDAALEKYRDPNA